MIIIIIMLVYSIFLYLNILISTIRPIFLDFICKYTTFLILAALQQQIRLSLGNLFGVQGRDHRLARFFLHSLANQGTKCTPFVS